MSAKRKHNMLTIKDKLAIIDMLDSGETMSEVATRFNIGRSTVYNIKERRTKIKAHTNFYDKRKTLKSGKFPELDTALHNWFLDERSKNNLVTGDMMKEKAKEIYLNLTGQVFKASSGWLDKFKKRFGIRFNVSGEKTFKSHDENKTASFVKTFKEKIEQLGLTHDQLYCTDASSLSLRILSKTSILKTENGSKILESDRITFMPCANATGTHKINLLVIGKEPAEELANSSLPICYKNQTNGWMTRDIFVEWFHDEFVPAVRTFMSMNNLPEKALLILDEAPGYPEEYYLKSNDWMIQAMFVPMEYCHLLQPMDKIVMQSLKCRYKKNILLNAISKVGDTKDNLRNLTFNDLMYTLTESWSSLSWNIIRKSWKKLCPSIETIFEEDDDEASDDVLVAFRGSGLNDKDINDWLTGKVKEINDEFSDVSKEITIESIKPEDPLNLQEKSEDLGIADSDIITVTNVKTEVD